MATKAVVRTNNTLRIIIAQHKNEGRSPSLNAVSTLYYNLISQTATDETWELFHAVASLPLTATHLEVSCVAQGCECEARRKRNHCLHALVEVSHTIQLESLDHYLFDRGNRIKSQIINSWWVDQIARALKVK